jgi:hypothetical protein
VLIVLVVCVRQAEYVSSKYSRESGSAVAACKLFCMVVLRERDRDCLCALERRKM